MRISSTRDLGLCVRDRRRDLRMTQAELAEAARVSRRWLLDLEAGKPTAEVGLVLRVLHALGLMIEAREASVAPGGIDLDELLHDLGRPSP